MIDGNNRNDGNDKNNEKPKKSKKVASPMQYFAPLCIYIMKTKIGKNEPKYAVFGKICMRVKFLFSGLVQYVDFMTFPKLCVRILF